MIHTVDSYRDEMQKELDSILDLMEKTWNYRPSLKLDVQSTLVIDAKYTYKGGRSRRRKIPQA